MANCKLYSITVGTGYRGGGMVIAARSKEEAIGLIHVYEDDIEKSFAKTKSPKEWLEKMLESLHENEKENNDNYSAIAVEV